MNELSNVVKTAANILASPAELTRLSVQELVATGRRAIELAGSFEEIKLISAQADALRAFQRSIGASVDAQNAAAEIRIRAEIRLGEELSKIEKNKGTAGHLPAGPGRGNISKNGGNAALPPFLGKRDTAPTLAEIGIPKHESARYQHLAAIPPETREIAIEAHRVTKTPMTPTSIARVADSLEALPEDTRRELIAKGDAELIANANAIRRERKEQAQQERQSQIEIAAAEVPTIDERYTLYLKSCKELTSILEPGCVDFIITDPPYPEKYLETFTELSKAAEILLKDDGVALIMSGQTYLPEVIARLSKHLKYHWMIAYLTPGGQAVQQFPRKVNTFWKPVLVYTKKEYIGPWFGDVARSDVNDNDKTHHNWGQSSSGFSDLMRRFVRPNTLVVDPFLGGGTTAVVALELGAKFVGSDIDENSLLSTRARIGLLQR